MERWSSHLPPFGRQAIRPNLPYQESDLEAIKALWKLYNEEIGGEGNEALRAYRLLCSYNRATPGRRCVTEALDWLEELVDKEK